MPANDLLLIALLLLVALLVGWWTGRSSARGNSSSKGGLPRDYFKGLNFLLNEEPDKALEVFIHMVEVDSDTIETHFALGSLFRRRGEVDRAIRIHQNLIARPNLPRRHRAQALYELGEDYLRAGLLDRAESLFMELSRDRLHEQSALKSLLTIFEQQKDWEKAIDAARRLETVSGQLHNREISHYYCELAELRFQATDIRGASKLVRRALSFDRECVRAILLNARIAEQGGDDRAAVRLYRRALDLDPRRAGEVLPGLSRVLRQSGKHNALRELLEGVIRDNPESSAAIIPAVLRDDEITGEELERFINNVGSSESLLDEVRILTDRLEALRTSGRSVLVPAVARELIRVAHAEIDHYICSECGYSGKTLYWQCPSCRRWDTLEPQQGITIGA